MFCTFTKLDHSPTASCCYSNAVAVFDLIQQICILFLSSAHHWEILNTHVLTSKDTIFVERLFDPRYSQHEKKISFSLTQNWKSTQK